MSSIISKMRAFLLFIILAVSSSSTPSQACLGCPLEERGKLRYDSGGVGVVEDDILKTIALVNPNLLGGKLQQQQLQQHQRLHQKASALAQRLPSLLSSSSSSSSSSDPLLPPPTITKSLSTSPNLFHLYTLLNKGSLEPRMVVDDYTVGAEQLPPKISKKAEKGMMIDVMDYLQKSEDRNRRVGQNMRSSG